MPPAPPRVQGQWALDQRAPLNAAEQVKQDDDGLNVRERIVTRYAREGFDSIDPQDLRQRFKWWGLYTQRAPGIDGGRTGSLSDAEIEDRYFMMRVRIPGGQLTAEQLRAVGDVATRYGRDVADVTDRQNVQYHWIRIEDVPAIWDRLPARGLSTTPPRGGAPRDTPRGTSSAARSPASTAPSSSTRPRCSAPPTPSRRATARSPTCPASGRPRS